MLKACSPCWQVIHSCKGWTACQKWICFYQKVKRLKEKKERGEMSKSGFLESIKNPQQTPVIVGHDCRNHLQQVTGNILAAFGSENEFILSTMRFVPKFYFHTAFCNAPELEFFIWKKKSIYGARQCILFVQGAEKKGKGGKIQWEFGRSRRAKMAESACAFARRVCNNVCIYSCALPLYHRGTMTRTLASKVVSLESEWIN